MFCGLENFIHPLNLPGSKLTGNWKINVDVLAESPSILWIALFFATVFRSHFQKSSDSTASSMMHKTVNTLAYQGRASPVQLNLQCGHGVFSYQYSFLPSLLVDRPVRRDYDLRLSWRSAAVETRKLHAEKDNWDLIFYLPLISVWGCWWGGWCWTLPAIAWEGGPWPVRDGGWQTGCSFLTNTNKWTF